MFAFWNHESRLSSKTVERLSHLLAVLYSVNTEQQFLSCASNLLLELTSRSPDFDRPMFEYPLAECRFEVCSSVFVLVFWLDIRSLVYLYVPFLLLSSVHVCLCVCLLYICKIDLVFSEFMGNLSCQRCCESPAFGDW